MCVRFVHQTTTSATHPKNFQDAPPKLACQKGYAILAKQF